MKNEFIEIQKKKKNYWNLFIYRLIFYFGLLISIPIAVEIIN